MRPVGNKHPKLFYVKECNALLEFATHLHVYSNIDLIRYIYYY